MFTTKDEKEIIEAIRQAEMLSTGEIRVHLDKNRNKEEDALSRAQFIFSKLGMANTQDRNAVLFYICEDRKKIAIIGDKNIHEHVKQSFWNELLDEMTHSFKLTEYRKGLISAILKTGYKLKKYFPNGENSKENELPNEISR